MSKSQGGYTLTEIIVAVAVIAILAGAMTPLIFKQIERSRDSRATQDINAFKAAFVQYYADTQFWPCGWNGARDRNQHVDIDDFSCLYEDDGQNGWDGPYLGASAGTSPQTVAVQDGDGQWTGVVDPWGAPYRLYARRANARNAEHGYIVLYSQGKDARRNTSVTELINGQAQGDDIVLVVSNRAKG